MTMFQENIVTAEKRSNGNPNILQSELFMPQEKRSCTELFTASPRGAKETSSSSSGRPLAEAKTNNTIQPVLETTPSAPSTSITHPRFVGCTTTPSSVRVRIQPPPDDSETPPQDTYRCLDCDYSTTRLNLFVSHQKYTHVHSNAKADKGAASKKLKYPPGILRMPRRSKNDKKIEKSVKKGVSKEIGDQKYYEVESIIDDGYDEVGHFHKYKLKWKGYPDSANSWVREGNLVNCPKLLAEYRQNKKCLSNNKK